MTSSPDQTRPGRNLFQSVRNIWTIMAKELSGFFSTSIGYTVILGYVLTTSLFFLAIIYILREAGSIPPSSRPLTLFYRNPYIFFIFMFFPSILSMRLFAHEKETGTIEMLLTVPVSDWEVVLGKYLATVFFYVLCLSPSLINYLVLFRPELARNVMFDIILPTLFFLPLIIFGFSFIKPDHKIGVVVGALAAAFIFVAALRIMDFDRITQRVRFIPADQIDMDNDGMADSWERANGLETNRDDSNEDPDGDRIANELEYMYGTDPHDKNDNLTSRILETVGPKNILSKGDEDKDNDGIPDKWERYLGLSSENGEDALQDNDGDGDSNLLEWQYGTDLSNPDETIRSKYIGYLQSYVTTLEKKYIDKDNDGMPDAWEETFNLALGEDDSGVDPDGDGFSNIEEYHYRTNPVFKDSVPSLPESKAWLLHMLSYILPVALFLFLSFPYPLKKEARIAFSLKQIGIGGLVLMFLLLTVFVSIGIKTESAYSLFLFWGFILLFLTITAILSRIVLLSRSKLNAGAVAVFLFLVFRIFWCFYIAEKAASQPDVGITFSGYLGGILMGALYISIGIFFSALFRNQIDAAVITFAALILIFISSLLPTWSDSVEPFKNFFYHYNFMLHLKNFSEGNIHSANIAFILSAIALCLFLTEKVLGVRKWK